MDRPPTDPTGEPALRHVTDLSVMDFIRPMKPTNRLIASTVSARFALLTTEICRDTEKLNIIVGYSSHAEVNDIVNRYSLNSNPSMQMLRNTDGNIKYPLFDANTRNSIMIQELTSELAEHIINTWTNVSDLTFCNKGAPSSVGDNPFDLLASMLEEAAFGNRIVSLSIIDQQAMGEKYDKNGNKAAKLFAAINRMRQLHNLELHFSGLSFQELPIVAKLKTLVLEIQPGSYSELVRSLTKYVRKGESDLAINLHNVFKCLPKLGGLQAHVKTHFVRLSNDYIPDPLQSANFVIHNFTSVHSLAISTSSLSFDRLCAALRNLPKLRHLKLKITFRQLSHFQMNANGDRIFPRRGVTLPSVEALDLNLKIAEHFQVNVLELTELLPNCSAIHVEQLRCDACITDTALYGKWQLPELADIARDVQCLRYVFDHLHAGLEMTQMSYDGEELFMAVPELMLAEVVID